MYSGCQFSIYPMADEFVAILTGALGALDPYRNRLKIETDDVSTLLVGPPELLLPAMRDVFVAVAETGVHSVLSATISRGCPGGEDQSICDTDEVIGAVSPLQTRIGNALSRIEEAGETGQQVTGQLALYVLGSQTHMDEVAGCIEILKGSGLLVRPKHYVTKFAGDAGPVFAGLGESFMRLGPEAGHVTLDVTVSANSPSPKS